MTWKLILLATFALISGLSVMVSCGGDGDDDDGGGGSNDDGDGLDCARICNILYGECGYAIPGESESECADDCEADGGVDASPCAKSCFTQYEQIADCASLQSCVIGCY